MTKRREFPRAIKIAVVKRAMRDAAIYCEACGLPAKKFQIDHVIADAHGGKPVIENAQLICDVCYGVKNAKDTTIAAKLKRVEARHLGIRKPSTLPVRGFVKIEREPKRLSAEKRCAGSPALMRRFGLMEDAS